MIVGFVAVEVLEMECGGERHRNGASTFGNE
jgi:hypothetical protein